MTVLDDIVAGVRADLAVREASLPLATLSDLARQECDPVVRKQDVAPAASRVPAAGGTRLAITSTGACRVTRARQG